MSLFKSALLNVFAKSGVSFDGRGKKGGRKGTSIDI
jgi:hypothetical protein